MTVLSQIFTQYIYLTISSYLQIQIIQCCSVDGLLFVASSLTKFSGIGQKKNPEKTQIPPKKAEYWTDNHPDQ